MFLSPTEIRALHDTRFNSVQMVMVSKSPGFKRFAITLFVLLRLKMDGSGEARFAGPVYGSKLSLRFGCSPVCIQQQLFSRATTSHTPSTL